MSAGDFRCVHGEWAQNCVRCSVERSPGPIVLVVTAATVAGEIAERENAAALRGARLALEAAADDAHDKWAAHRSETTGFTHWKDVEAWLRARSLSPESIVKEFKP